MARLSPHSYRIDGATPQKTSLAGDSGCACFVAIRDTNHRQNGDSGRTTRNSRAIGTALGRTIFLIVTAGKLVKSGTWNDTILAGHREYLRDQPRKEAFDALVRAAIDSPHYAVGPAWHGEIRDFRYFDVVAEEQPFAFIVNRADLLFYVRSKGLRQVAGGFGALKRRFPSAAENSRGEWTVRIASMDDADRLNELLFAPQSTDSGATPDVR